MVPVVAKRLACLAASASIALVLLIGCAGGSESQEGSCVVQKSATRGIRNGTSPDLCNFGSVVRLDIIGRGNVQAVCSGTLIRQNVVLSAAHCFVDPELSPVLRVTVHAVGTKTTARAIAYRVNAGYNQNSLDSPDLSVVYLSTNMPVSPATLTSQSVSTGDSIVALGYGRDGRGSDGDGNLGSLLQGTLRVADPGSTSRNLRTTQTGPSAQDTCSGDSGGPAFSSRKVLVGVLSGGDYSGSVDNCRSSSNSIFTPVAFYANWINQAVSRGTSGATGIGN